MPCRVLFCLVRLALQKRPHGFPCCNSIAAGRRIRDVAVGPNECDLLARPQSELEGFAHGSGELSRRFLDGRVGVVIQHEQETAANAITAAQRTLEVPLSRSLHNWASAIGNP